MKQPGRGTHGAALQSQPLGTRDDTQLSWLKLGAKEKLSCVSTKCPKESFNGLQF